MRLSGVLGQERSCPAQDLIALWSEFDADLVVEAYRAVVFAMPLH